MFIRIKKIKDTQYAYLVKNKWTKKGARQKTVRYLGRVFRPAQLQSLTFHDVLGADGLDESKLAAVDYLRLLIKTELLNHGFIEKESLVFERDKLNVDLTRAKVRVGMKRAAININEDFMCDFTLKRLLKFSCQGTQEEVGTELAKAFIGAGIPVEQEIFITVFSKVYREGISRV
ncbi:MAG: hypothetical protein ABH879_09535 [archaeon]